MTLTFDDGPSEWTPLILDVLADYGQQATFFATGASIPDRFGILRRAIDEGHTVGVHGLTHRRLTELDDHDVRVELSVTRALILLAVGVTPTLFRAPYYGTDERVNAIAAQLGLEHVGASVIPDDWACGDAEVIAERCLDLIRPGSVVSLHDGIPPRGGSSSCTSSRQPTVDAVQLILQGLAA